MTTANNGRGLKESQAFTLIELVIVVAIIGILSAIAYASYQSQIIKSRRTDGLNSILGCAAEQRRRFTITNAFSDSDICDTVSEEGFYSITVTTHDENTRFTISGTPLGAQSADLRCQVLRITSTGVKSSVPAENVDECWK